MCKAYTQTTNTFAGVSKPPEPGPSVLSERLPSLVKPRAPIAAPRQQPITPTAAPRNLPPPPPPLPSSNIAPIQWLPAHLKPKKRIQANVLMKKLNWPVIDPRKISKNSFWVKCQEDELASEDVFAGLAAKFSQKIVAKVAESSSVQRFTARKCIELRVIDRKSAHAISVLLRASLKRVPYEQIKECILRCDTSKTSLLTSDIIQHLIKYLPSSPDQLKRLHEMKQSGDVLSEPETFIATIGEIDQLVPRLHSIDLKLCLDDLARKIESDIDIGSAACEELQRSKKFGKILGVILLFGNYLNSGLVNSQAFGFDISFLTQLIETKDLNNQQTLLHYVVETIEKKIPEVLGFVEELPHAKEAAKISLVRITDDMEQITTSLENLNIALQNIKKPQSFDDKFLEIMGGIAVQYNEKVEALIETKKRMENGYKRLGEYFSFDAEKYPMEDLFKDINTFITMFKEAHFEVQRK